jgi:2-keto-4-pentenoate hydratase/2-oxohepta-3-ene-1,7-dioic acid hydratase in catechol pathway
MKIVRFKVKVDVQPQYGIVEGEELFPCSGDPFTGLTKQAKTLDFHSVKLLSPISPPNVICVGLNYRRHAQEAGDALPPKPLIFLKPTTSVCGPGDPIVLPFHDPEKIDYEVELAIVIGKKAKCVPEVNVPEVILGYTIANDVSNRGAQFQESQWARGKSYDTFCPLGPMIETDLDGDHLNLICRLDGKVMQASNTSDMIFSTRQLVSYISECMTLLPGTVILTGTPEGVGFARKPPVFLKEGQRVECEIEGIGILSNPVVRQR